MDYCSGLPGIRLDSSNIELVSCANGRHLFLALFLFAAHIKLIKLANSQLIMNKILKFIVILAIAIQLSLSSYYILRWFHGMINTYITYIKLPKEERIFTTSLDEYYCILYIRKNLPDDANMLWIWKPSDFVNYYVYPRKTYKIKEYLSDEVIEIDKNFLREKNIGYVIFDLKKIYNIKDLDIVEKLDKVIIGRK